MSFGGTKPFFMDKSKLSCSVQVPGHAKRPVTHVMCCCSEVTRCDRVGKPGFHLVDDVKDSEALF
jgi:hypothetical protein